jgi:benzoate membrane transport protein
MKKDIASPISAGVVTAVVGFSSSFVLVMEGLKHVGATDSQALSGLIAVTIAFSIGMVYLAWRTRVPMTMAWSTPGAALLLTTAAPHTGFSGAVGAFILCAVLVALCGLVKPLGHLVMGIPVSLTQALLAGILIPICIQPFVAAGHQPLAVIPLLAVYAGLTFWAPRWAVPAVLVVALGESLAGFLASGRTWVWDAPRLEYVAPALDVPALLSVGVSLFIVTMAAQNLPGIGMLRSFGHTPPWRASMVTCGVTSGVGSLFGSHAANLSSLSAAIALGDMSGRDPRTKWWATPAAAVTYLVLAVSAGSMVALMASAPAGIMATLAGLALLPTFTSTASAAFADRDYATANGAVIIISASGVTLGGFSAAVFAFAAGLLMHALTRVLRRRSAHHGR